MEMKDVIEQAENVFPFVMDLYVPKVLIVKQAITEKYVPACPHCLEMAMYIAPKVNKYLKIAAVFKFMELNKYFSKCVAFFLAVITPNPECRVDRDCSASLVCSQETCQNPCRTNNPCQGNQECQVYDRTDGKKSVACTCPLGFVTSQNNFCTPGK